MENITLLDNDLRMEKKLRETISFRCEDEFLIIVNHIAQVERRTGGAVARAIFERGLAAYNRDGMLFESEPLDTAEVLEKFKVKERA